MSIHKKPSAAKQQKIAEGKRRKIEQAKKRKLSTANKTPSVNRCPLHVIEGCAITLIRDCEKRGYITKELADLLVKANILCTFELIKAFKMGQRIWGIGPKRKMEVEAFMQRLKLY